MHGVASSTFYDARQRTIKAINSEYADAVHFPWDDTAELQTMSDEFYAANKQSLEGCVLAVDGLLVKIKQRTSRDTRNPVAYYTRKGFHALNVQAGCDARLRFRVVSIEHTGSTHDSLAWGITNAAKLLESGRFSVLLLRRRRRVRGTRPDARALARKAAAQCASQQGRIQLLSERVRTEPVPHFPARSATLHLYLI